MTRFYAFTIIALCLMSDVTRANDSDCINPKNLSIINLNSNNSFAEVSWKVDVSNVCSYAVSIDYTWEAIDNNDFVIDSNFGFGEIIPPDSTVSIKNIELLSPPDKLQKLYRHLFTPTRIKLIDNTTFSCLSTTEENSLIFDQNDSFIQLGWSVLIRNKCDTGIKANVTNYVLEGNSHAIDYGLAYFEYFPPNATKAVFGTHLVDTELREGIVETKSTIKSPEVANLPEQVEYAEWIFAAGSILNMETGVLATSIDVGNGKYSIAGFSLNPDLTFTFLPDTLVDDNYPIRHRSSSFSSTTGKLTIPNLAVLDYPGIDVLEHVELQLIDSNLYTFSFEGYSDSANPNFTYSTNKTSDCLVVKDADIQELSRSTAYAEISYKIEVMNSCNQGFQFSSYLHFLTQYNVEIDYDLMFGKFIEGNVTKTFSDTTLLDLIEIDNTAKIHVKISP